MAATFTWSVTNCTRNTVSGEILRASWKCLATETAGLGDNQAIYESAVEGTQSLSPSNPSNFVLYADVTQDQILGWLWNSSVDKEEIEQSLQIDINDLQEPPTADGLPWDETVS